MGIIGNLFPASEKQKFADEHVQPGQVLYLNCAFMNPPREKYVLLAHTDTRCLLFIINSRIHPYIASRPYLAQAQVQIDVSNYPFLDHDSYMNCSEVIDSVDVEEIRRQVLDDLSRVKGGANAATI